MNFTPQLFLIAVTGNQFAVKLSALFVARTDLIVDHRVLREEPPEETANAAVSGMEVSSGSSVMTFDVRSAIDYSFSVVLS